VDLVYARRVVSDEARAVAALRGKVGADFRLAAALILSRCAPRASAADRNAARRAGCDTGGRVAATGVGKAGIIAQKVSATLASTGTPSLFLHPTEALHGDLGMVMAGDVVIAFSYSGESEELLRLVPPLKKMRSTLSPPVCSL
jgi:arabinose-5-phosphate isomerase